MSTRALSAAFCLAAAAVLLADQNPPPQTTFRAGVELVAVDFIATTGDGRLITDLRSEDLTLKVDGRVHDIRELQFIRLAKESDAAVPVSSAASLPLPFGTNQAGEIGRAVIVLFDNERIRSGNERAAKEAAMRFVDRLAPHDRVALVTAARVNVDLTTAHDRVREALKSMVGHGVADATIRAGGQPVQEAGPATAWIRSALEGLKDIDGPKTVILISEGVPAIAPIYSAGGGPPDPRIAADYQAIARAAGAVRAQLYLIQPDNFAIDASQNSTDLRMEPDPLKAATGDRTGLPAGGDFHAEEDSKLAGLQDLAATTGGELFRLSGSADAVFQKIMRQSSAYYLLGFEAAASERNAKSHQIEIRAVRPGVTIRARPEFTIPKPADSGAAAGPALTQMLTDTKMYREIPLRAAAYSARGAKGMLNILVVAESIDGSIPLAGVSFGLLDTTSRRMTAAWPAPAAAISAGRAFSGAAAPSGTYRLRVAALGSDGRRGAADYEFVAGLTKAGPLELGDLMLGEGRTDGTFTPELEFSDRATAGGYLELYGALDKGTSLSVLFELATTLDGPTLLSIPGIAGPTTTPERWVARGVIPVGAVPPGDYAVRAVVKVDGVVVGHVLRAMRKSR